MYSSNNVVKERKEISKLGRTEIAL